MLGWFGGVGRCFGSQADRLRFGSGKGAKWAWDVSGCRVWRLRDDAVIFEGRVQSRAALVVEKPAGVEDLWKNFRECLTGEAIGVCAETRRMGRGESWWWNGEIAALVWERWRSFGLLRGLGGAEGVQM